MNILLLGYDEKLMENAVKSINLYQPEDNLIICNDNKKNNTIYTKNQMNNLRERFIDEQNIHNDIIINYVLKHNHFSKLLGIYYAKKIYNVDNFFYTDDDVVIVNKLPVINENAFIKDPFLTMRYRETKMKGKHSIACKRQVAYIDKVNPTFNYDCFCLSGNFYFKWDESYESMLSTLLYDSEIPLSFSDKQKRSSASAMDDSVLLAAYADKNKYIRLKSSFIVAYGATKDYLDNRKINNNTYILHYAIKEKVELSDRFYEISKIKWKDDKI